MRTLSIALALVTPAFAQLASDDFETGNPNGWGVEFTQPGTWDAMGGNPGGRLEVTVQSSNSQLPAAMIVPATAGHPFRGDFRALDVSKFSFDRQVEMGSSNFGTLPFLVLGHDGGTPNDFADDAWTFTWTGDSFQFGMTPWATITTFIPVDDTTLPANWDAVALPNSPFAGLSAEMIWNEIVVDVDYIGIAMNRPWNGGPWFGAHILSLDNFLLEGPDTLGTNYCMANPNSSGNTGNCSATGNTVAANNDVTLHATLLPQNAFGFFLVSSTPGFVANPAGSEGNLCLGGAIGRYVGPGQIQNSGGSGDFDLAIDLTMTPQPTMTVSIVGGQTWNFQAWFRDSVGGMATSNFTDGLAIDFN